MPRRSTAGSAALVLAIALVGLAACYDPSYAPDIACGPGGSCPAGRTCGDDGRCHAPGEGGSTPEEGAQADARVVEDEPSDPAPSGDAAPPDAAPPDATPVECEGDGECQTPPSACLRPGTCNLDTHTCSFPAVDCSSLDGECTVGVCAPESGQCVASPRRQGEGCGAGVSCGPFGACAAEAGVCDETGSQTRSCTVFTCQTGVCTGATRDDRADCLLDTDGVTCAGPTTTCGNCQYSNFCDESAPRTCTDRTFSCAGGTCTSSDSQRVETCTRDTDGSFCTGDGTCRNGTCVPNPCPSCFPWR